jgi:hypothetical protein
LFAHCASAVQATQVPPEQMGFVPVHCVLFRQPLQTPAPSQKPPEQGSFGFFTGYEHL